jgi:cholinesterase
MKSAKAKPPLWAAAASLGALWALFICPNAGAVGRYNAIFAFGDSYSDIGARYVDGNGPTAVAYLAQDLGLDMTYPQSAIANGKSLDFASSGAVTGREPGHPGYSVHGEHWCCQGMLDQVEDFVRKVHEGQISFDPEHTLFFIAGGLNDKMYATALTMRNLKREITLLKDAGAYHISLALLPTQIANFAGQGERLNPAYRQLVSELQPRLQIDLHLNNWGPYFDQIMENPASYGITNTSSRCAGRVINYEDATPCQTPQTYYYYHKDHPSTAVHKLVGEMLYQDIVKESLAAKTTLVGQAASPH